MDIQIYKNKNKKMEKWLYVIYFWKNANKEMIEDMLTLSIDEISDYIVEMWKMFYESVRYQDDNWMMIKMINSRWCLEDNKFLLV